MQQRVAFGVNCRYKELVGKKKRKKVFKTEDSLVCLRSFKAAKICYQYLVELNPYYRYNFDAIYRSCLQKNQDSNYQYAARLEEIVREMGASR